MKKRLVALISAAAALTSCGTAAQYASSGQRYQDGIYYKPETEHMTTVTTDDIERLVARTEETEILLFGDRKDTVTIPENKSAVIRFGDGTGTTVTITDDPFTDIYYSTYPWTYYRPVTYTSLWWDPWYYGRYWGYYDPWYWSGWYYDPWFWGYSGIFWDPWFYNPWFWGAPRLPYNPYWHHHHHHYYGHDTGHAGHYYGHRTGGTASVRTHTPRSLSGTGGIRSSASIRNGSTGNRTSSSSYVSPYRRSASSVSGSASSGRTSVRRTSSAAGNTYTSGISAVRRSSSGNSSGTAVTSGQSSYRRGNGYIATGTSGVRSSVSNYRRPVTRSASSTTSYGNSTGTSGYNSRSAAGFGTRSSGTDM